MGWGQPEPREGRQARTGQRPKHQGPDPQTSRLTQRLGQGRGLLEEGPGAQGRPKERRGGLLSRGEGAQGKHGPTPRWQGWRDGPRRGWELAESFEPWETEAPPGAEAGRLQRPAGSPLGPAGSPGRAGSAISRAWGPTLRRVGGIALRCLRDVGGVRVPQWVAHPRRSQVRAPGSPSRLGRNGRRHSQAQAHTHTHTHGDCRKTRGQPGGGGGRASRHIWKTRAGPVEEKRGETDRTAVCSSRQRGQVRAEGDRQTDNG